MVNLLAGAGSAVGAGVELVVETMVYPLAVLADNTGLFGLSEIVAWVRDDPAVFWANGLSFPQLGSRAMGKMRRDCHSQDCPPAPGL